MALTKKLSGGKKLEEALKLLAAKAKNSAVLSVGFPEGDRYPPDKNGNMQSVPFVAAMNEFGGEHRPPRPFFRGMISRESPQWGSMLGKALKLTDYDAVEALDLVGEDIKGALNDSIEQFTEPKLAESTIAAKRKKGIAEPEKPLVETALMLGSVKSFVEKT